MRRISNFLRGRAASLRVTTGRPTPPAVCRTRSLSAAANAAAVKSGSTTPTRRKAAEAAASPTDLTQLKVRPPPDCSSPRTQDDLCFCCVYFACSSAISHPPAQLPRLLLATLQEFKITAPDALVFYEAQCEASGDTHTRIAGGCHVHLVLHLIYRVIQCLACPNHES